MLELGVAIAALIAGFVVARRKPPKARHETMLALRPATTATGTYREQPGGEITCTLDELRARLAAAALPHELEGDTLHVRRDAESLRIVIPEAQRVTLASIDIYQVGCEKLAYELALALVPVFGPLTMADGLWGTFAVDERTSVVALEDERSERIKTMASRIAADMQHKMAVYS
ncbi:MAG: hypothetical protein ABI867_27025 [Kofleriaceae bacterium]